MPGTTRYNGNHNNLYFGMGAVTPDEKEKIRKIILQETSRPYQILLYAKMKRGHWFTWDDLIELNPQKYGGKNANPQRKNVCLKRILQHDFIETNPDNPHQYRITPLGVKYLFCRQHLVPKDRNRKKRNG
jgi:hypothetical protein